jgi:mono/diheme cytochrome c family protein
MKTLTVNKISNFLFVIFLLPFVSCTEDYFPIPPPLPPPETPKETSTVEAKYVTTPPSTVNNSYWSKANFRKVSLSNLNYNELYGDGLLNMTGTINGLSSFNNGTNPNVTMKAAYDDDHVYILIEWADKRIDASNSSWLYNGPADPLKPGESNAGWTSQRNSDKVALAFEVSSASGAAGNFSDVGCAASCHGNAMKPQSGKVDIWNWALDQSEAMGYAHDMVTDDVDGLKFDFGTPSGFRNNAGTTDRDGPAFEWNGVLQSITRPNGTTSILDPAYYLLNKTPFIGDVSAGESLYNNSNKGCYGCHGSEGQGGGPFGDGPSFTRPELNRFSRDVFKDYAASISHSGFSYFNQLNPTEADDLIAYIRGLSGVPGYALQAPDNSSADIMAASNVPLAKIESQVVHDRYKVLLVRKLDTGNNDDVIFNLSSGNSFVFGISLMDNDGKNHVGSLKEILTFLPK